MKRFVAIDTRDTTVFDVAVAKDLITAVRQMYERVYPQYDPRDLSFRQVGQFAWSEHAHMLDVYLITADLQDVYRSRCDDDIITSIESYDGTFISRVECETKKKVDLELAIKNATSGLDELKRFRAARDALDLECAAISLFVALMVVRKVARESGIDLFDCDGANAMMNAQD